MVSRKSGNGKALRLDRGELRRRLGQLPARDRLRALIEAPNAKELVRSVPAQDLYQAIGEVGLADSTRVVQLASRFQFRTLVDLGGWVKDRIDLRQLLTWLRAARGGDSEEFLSKIHYLDPELLEFVLRSATIIHDLQENQDVATRGPTVETPEGKFLIELTVEGAELSAIRALLLQLIAENPFQATRLFEAIRWEIPSELEETAYRFRSGRLADLGFPPVEEALAIFSFEEPGAPPIAVALSDQLAPLVGTDFVEAGLGELMDVERDGLEEQLRYLTNSALVAEGGEPGDLPGIARVTQLVREYLNLGIEHLTGGDRRRAGAIVRENSARRLFQIGFSLTLKLKFQADRLSRQPLAQIDDAYLLFPDEEAVVRALRRKRPLFVGDALAVEMGFRSRWQLVQVEAALRRAADQVALLSALLGGNLSVARAAISRFEAPLGQLGVDRLFAAVSAHALLDGQLHVGPVERTRVLELCERMLDKDSSNALRAAAIEHAFSVLAPTAPERAWPELRRLLNMTLSQLASDLAPAYLSGSPPDEVSLVHLPTASRPEVL